MLGTLRLYLRYAGISIRSQLQYRASFVMLALGHLLITGIEILAIWALFARFRSLQGWRLEEVALLYGLVHVAFALAEGMGRGFDLFPGLVRTGEFDRLLLRPRSTAFQIAARDIQLMRLGRLVQGLAVLFWAAWALEVHWSVARVALVCFAVLGGACLYTGLFVLQATLAFWTTESLEATNTVTYGGVETSQLPLSIYRPWFRKFFTFVVPLACVSYFPALGILGRQDLATGSPTWFLWLAPGIGVFFLVMALRCWKLGVRHYRSTGS